MCSLLLTHPSAHTWSSGQLTLRRPGSNWGFGALLKGLISVMDNSCQSRDSNPQPRVTSTTLYPLEPRLPPNTGEIHKEWTEAGVSASRVTTLRRLQEKGYQATSEPETTSKHLTWAVEKKNWTVAQWSKVLQSKFCI